MGGGGGGEGVDWRGGVVIEYKYAVCSWNSSTNQHAEQYSNKPSKNILKNEEKFI